MSKRGKTILIFSMILILAGTWTWRYITLNSYYHGLVPEEEQYREYAIGDTVPMGLFGEGYSVRVDGFRFVECDEIAPELYEMSTIGKKGYEGKFGFLDVTIFNDDSEGGVLLTDLLLHGTDTTFPVEWALLKGLNPELGDSYGVKLDKGSGHSFVIPFGFLKVQFPTSWNRLDSRKIYLSLGDSVDVRVQ